MNGTINVLVIGYPQLLVSALISIHIALYFVFTDHSKASKTKIYCMFGTVVFALAVFVVNMAQHQS